MGADEYVCCQSIMCRHCEYMYMYNDEITYKTVQHESRFKIFRSGTVYFPLTTGAFMLGSKCPLPEI